MIPGVQPALAIGSAAAYGECDMISYVHSHPSLSEPRQNPHVKPLMNKRHWE